MKVKAVIIQDSIESSVVKLANSNNTSVGYTGKEVSGTHIIGQAMDKNKVLRLVRNKNSKLPSLAAGQNRTVDNIGTDGL